MNMCRNVLTGLCLLLTTMVFSEEDTKRMQVDFESLEEAELYISEQVEFFTIMTETFASFSIDVEPVVEAPGGAFDEQFRNSEPSFIAAYRWPDKKEIKSIVKTGVDALYFSLEQDLMPPLSTVDLSLLVNLDSELDHHTYFPSDFRYSNLVGLKNVVIQYSDGSSEQTDFSDKIAYGKVRNFELNSAKVINNIKVDAVFEYPVSYSTYTFNDDVSELMIDDVLVSFKRVSPSHVEITYDDALSGRIVYREGWHKGGQTLEKQDLENDTLLPEQADVVYKTFLQAEEKFKNNEFSDVNEVKSYLEARLPPELIKEKDTTIESLAFYGDVSEVRLTLPSAKTKKVKKKVGISNLDFHNNTVGYYVAYDQSSELEGLVDEGGEWVIKPRFEKLEYFDSNIFFNPFELKSYYLTKDGKSVVEKKFMPKKRLSDNLLVVMPSINDWNYQHSSSDDNNLGIVDSRTDELIAPMKYVDFNIWNDLIYTVKYNDGKYAKGLMNLKGEVLADNVFPLLEGDGNGKYLYGSSYSGAPESRQVFNAKGMAMIPKGWRAEDRYGADDILLIKKCLDRVAGENEFYTGPICSDYRYVDEHGNTINLDHLNIKNASRFSNGYAAVQNQEDLWGYIDTSGKLIIPFKYKSANLFQSKYALVQAQNGYRRLIDVDDNIFINFKDADISVGRRSNDNGVITLSYEIDGVVYDEYAEELPLSTESEVSVSDK